MSKQKKTSIAVRYTAPALSKGLEILELLASSGAPLSQADISRSLGRSAAELFRMLSVLESHGYVARDSAGCYAATLRLFLLGQSVDPVRSLVAAARQAMRDFSLQTGCECHLSLLSGGKLVVVAQEAGSGPVTIHIRPGSEHNPLRTASGRAILSAMNRSRAKIEYQDACSRFPGPHQSWSLFSKHLAEIHAAGISVAHSESLQGLSDMACFIPDASHRLQAALAISHFFDRQHPDTALEKHLRSACHTIAENLM